MNIATVSLAAVAFAVSGAIAGPDNLLQNPGFEEGVGASPEGWTIGDLPVGVIIKRDERFQHAGAASLRLSKTARNFWPLAEISQRIELDPGQGGLEVGAIIRARKAHKVVIDVQFAVGAETVHEWGVYVGAQNEGDPPVDHDWEERSGVVAIPEGARSAVVAFQIYGPGICWIDEAWARYAPAPEPAADDGASRSGVAPSTPGADEWNVSQHFVGTDQQQRYFLHTPASGPPDEGFRLLLVVPGGDGSAEFQEFVSNIAKNAAGNRYLVAQLVAPAVTDPKVLVWPIEKNQDPAVAVSTEAFIDGVIAGVRDRYTIDPRHVYILGWSSGGPPSYAATLREGSPIRGAFVAMSVFKPEQVADLHEAAGRAFYLLHSPEDPIPMRFPRDAMQQLGHGGAEVRLVEYAGGHGWHGDVFGTIRKGIAWLEEHSTAPAAEEKREEDDEP